MFSDALLINQMPPNIDLFRYNELKNWFRFIFILKFPKLDYYPRI